MSISNEGNGYLQVSWTFLFVLIWLFCACLGWKWCLENSHETSFLPLPKMLHVHGCFVGKPILEALQGWPTFLLSCYKNFSGASISSCMFVRTFYAIFFSRGNLICQQISLSKPQEILVVTYQLVILKYYTHADTLCMFWLYWRYLSSSIFLLKLLFHWKKEILIGQADLGISCLQVTKLGHQSHCLRNWFVPAVYVFYSIFLKPYDSFGSWCLI